MMTSQILQFVDIAEIQKSKYLENKTFFLQIKKNSLHIKGYFMAKNTFVAEGTFKRTGDFSFRHSL